MDNDGTFPDDSGVEVRDPLTQEQYDGDRDEWSWLWGTITQQCGPDEWQVCVRGHPRSHPQGRQQADRPHAAPQPGLPAVLPGRQRNPEGVVTRQDVTRQIPTGIVATVAILQVSCNTRQRASADSR